MSDNDSVAEIEGLMKANKIDSTTIEKIMDKLIVIDKNLILKTDIENSKNFVILKVIANEMKKKKLFKSAKTIETFCDWYIKVRVSNHRLSRKEILDAISAIRRENQPTSILTKLTGIGDKNEK